VKVFFTIILILDASSYTVSSTIPSSQPVYGPPSNDLTNDLFSTFQSNATDSIPVSDYVNIRKLKKIFTVLVPYVSQYVWFNELLNANLKSNGYILKANLSWSPTSANFAN